jgi:enolase
VLGRRRSGTKAGSRLRCASTRDALDFIMKSVEQAGYRPGDDVVLALDCAATEYYRDGAYRMEGEGRTFSPEEMVGFLAELAALTRSRRSRTAWPRTIGKAGSC